MSSLTQFRLALLIPATLLGLFLSAHVRTAWSHYWLIHDEQQGMALIIREHPKRVLDYKYTANQKEYTGRSRSNWEGPYKVVRVGDEAPVYFSASHPWISALHRPRAVVEGLPVLIAALFLELLLIATMLRPKSNCALKLDGMNADGATS